MSDLRELLDTRAQAEPAEILDALRDGLSRRPADSGVSADFHQLLLDYFRMDELIINDGHVRAFRKYPVAARQLLRIVEDEGEDQVAELMQSFLDGKPRPLGALREGLEGPGAAEAARHGPGMVAVLQAFTDAATGTPEAAAEIELSLVWDVVEEALADRVVLMSQDLAFRYGERHRQAMARAAALDALVATMDIAALVQAIASARKPCILAGDGEVPAADRMEVPVRHQLHHRKLGPAAALPGGPATAQLRALYNATNGAELFIPVTHKPKHAGLLLIPDSEWASERKRVIKWAEIGHDEDGGLPAWARTLVPIAVLPGDSSRWVVPVEGPRAGEVMLTDDIADGHVRYRSIAHFLAALRLMPQEILSCGGYVQYCVDRKCFVTVYPEAYREDA